MCSWTVLVVSANFPTLAVMSSFEVFRIITVPLVAKQNAFQKFPAFFSVFVFCAFLKRSAILLQDGGHYCQKYLRIPHWLAVG